MAKLSLSVAVGDYDRTRPLIDGGVQIDGVDPVIMALTPEEIFFRAFRHEEFDICELSFSSYTLNPRTWSESASARRNISSPRMSGRVRSCRMISA
jgi:hypothetical protein